MAELLTFKEFKERHNDQFEKWRYWPVQQENIPVVLAWCKDHAIGDYCLKIPSWARNPDRGRAHITANHTILFVNRKDRSTITKTLGNFWAKGVLIEYDGIQTDPEFVWVDVG
jgi:hypothetical protein